MHDTDTSTPIETDTEIPTFDFAILFWGGWAVGNSLDECLDNGKRFGLRHKTQTPYLLVAFSEPVQHVRASMFGLEWQWTDVVGKATEIPMNGYGKEG